MNDPENNPAHSAVVVGRTSELPLVKGWHERETDGRFGIPYRASDEDGLVVLRRVPRSRRLCLILAAPVILYGGRMKSRIIINGRKYELPIDVDAWVLRAYPIESSRDVLRIHIHHKDPVSADQVLGNGDARRLAWFLSAIWQE